MSEKSSSVCWRPRRTNSPASSFASERVTRPRSAASSSVSWIRSRVSITKSRGLTMRLANWSTRLERPSATVPPAREVRFAVDAPLAARALLAREAEDRLLPLARERCEGLLARLREAPDEVPPREAPDEVRRDFGRLEPRAFVDFVAL